MQSFGLLIRQRLSSKDGVKAALHMHFSSTQSDSAIDEHCLASPLQESPIISAAENITSIKFLSVNIFL
jgi:hypothetical protein